MKHGQAFSFDILLALVIFVGATFVFLALFAINQNSQEEELQEEAIKVLEDISRDDSSVAIFEDNKINSTKLQNFLTQNYSDIKEQMRVQNDFCIYLEDEDGNLINLSIDTRGKGSSKINLSGVPCN